MIADGPIESRRSAQMIGSMEPDGVNDRADSATAILGLAHQGRRGRTYELTMTATGRPVAPWA